MHKQLKPLGFLLWLATGCEVPTDAQSDAGARGGDDAEAQTDEQQARADAGSDAGEDAEPAAAPSQTGAKPEADAGAAGKAAPAPSMQSPAGASAGAAGSDMPAMMAPLTAAPTVSTEITKVAYNQTTNGTGKPIPVLLYAGGYASYNISLITEPIDIAYDIVEHPDAWPLWRQGNERVELQEAGAWTPVHYAYETQPLPADTRVSGLFERYVENIPDPNLGGNAHRYRYKFSDDGTFEFCDASVVIVVASGTIRYENALKKGRYAVEGLTIQYTFDDGSPSERYPFFFDPERPTRFWLRSAHFENTKDQTLPTCEKP
jgi:hypothetical protein